MKDRIKKKRSGNSVKMLLVLDHKKSKKIIKLYRHLRVNESNKSFNKQKKIKKVNRVKKSTSIARLFFCTHYAKISFRKKRNY